MALENGHYAPVTAKKVTHWPAPDADGDGDVVWEEQYDGQGNSLGRNTAKDNQGREIRHYEAPDGFRNVASRDAGSDGITDNYVKVDERGRVWRHPLTKQAQRIKPGTTLVEHPNGDFELLEDDFSRYLFEKSHEKVDAPEDKSNLEAPKSDKERQTEEEERDRAEFEEWKQKNRNANRGDDT